MLCLFFLFLGAVRNWEGWPLDTGQALVFFASCINKFSIDFL